MATRRFSELADVSRAQADPERRARIEEMQKAMLDAARLGELRSASNLTQRELASRLGVSQANVSRVERGDDVYLSTLRNYVEALGGELRLSAVFDDEAVDIIVGS